jgi:hypothetical protein
MVQHYQIEGRKEFIQRLFVDHDAARARDVGIDKGIRACKISKSEMVKSSKQSDHFRSRSQSIFDSKFSPRIGSSKDLGNSLRTPGRFSLKYFPRGLRPVTRNRPTNFAAARRRNFRATSTGADGSIE